MKPLDPSTIGTHFDAKQAEERWDRQWDEGDVHRFEEAGTGGTFLIDTPPPTVSGSLHVGHVFSYAQTDAVARHRRMRGCRVFYPMGWDDNGLPTERRVQNYFHVRCEPALAYEPGLSLAAADENARKGPARGVSRPNFIELCLALTGEDEKAFKALWRRLGLSVDWRYEYSTIDDRSRRFAQMSFLELLREGHVYSQEAPTQWDVDFRTAVAQAEVEDRIVRGAYHEIRFGVEGSGQDLLIATTRPELLPACVGVAVHPADERHRGLVGGRAITPLFRAPVPIFASEQVDPEKGTGLVMVCTFGDATDIAWWREHDLPLRQVVGRDGRLVPVEFGGERFPSLDPEAANRHYAPLANRRVEEARRAIVERLRDPAGSASKDGRPPLPGEPKPIEHPVRFFEKGDRPLEFVTSRQWFVRILERKQDLLDAGDRVSWHPDFMRRRYRNWVENLQLDWCISRQRYFGVPFPLWYPVRPQGETDFGRPILAEEAALPVDPMNDAPSGRSEEERDRPAGFRPEADVFDTWFTSSLTPQIVTGWREAPERHRRLFPMDLRPQSHEIIRTWAFYTIVKALLHERDVPWRHVAISGWVLDPERKKMSKSRGNVVTPMHLLDRYGADAVRYWALSARLGVDTAFDEKVCAVGRRLVTKLFNVGKLVLALDGAEGAITCELDLSFLARLREIVERAGAAMEALEHAAALDLVQRFFWGSFTDTYVELVKTRARSEADAGGRGSAVAALRLALETLLRLFAPFLPYITEEVWSWSFAGTGPGRSVHRAPWPRAAELAALPAVEGAGAVFDAAVAFLEEVRRAKGAAGATVGRHLARLRVAARPLTAALLERAREDARSAARAREMAIEPRDEVEPGRFAVLEAALADVEPAGF